MHNLDILYKQVDIPASNAKQPSMVEVHLNPHELQGLTQLQGSAHNNNAGVPQFGKLWKEFLSHEPIQNAIHHHVREHKAEGGLLGEHYARLERDGRYGDTRIALMPRPMVEYLEHHYGKSINPKDGKPEFYLGDMLSGASRYMQPVLDKIAAGARYAGSAASRLGRNIMSGARYAGNRAYDYGSRAANFVRTPPAMHPGHPGRPQQAMPQRVEAALARQDPRTWSQTLGPYGRSMAEAAAHYIAPPAGAIAGMAIGPRVMRYIASNTLPFIPGFARNPLADIIGTAAGGTAGRALAAHYGPQIAGHIGERAAEGIGSGLDYLSGQAARPVQAARRAATGISARVGPYASAAREKIAPMTQRVGDLASNAASTLGNAANTALNTAHSYTPSGMQARAANAFSAGMPGIAELQAQHQPQGWGSYFGDRLSGGLDTLSQYSPASMLARLATGREGYAQVPQRDLGMPGQQAMAVQERMPLLNNRSRPRGDSPEGMRANWGNPLLPDLD